MAGWFFVCFLSCFVFLVPIVVVAVVVVVVAAALVGADADVQLQLLVEGLFEKTGKRHTRE